MNLDNITKGMIVKNYKELCRLLELDVKTGGARKNQLEWIEDYIGYDKEGHKFIIKDIHDDIEIIPMKTRGGLTYTVDYPAFNVDFEDWKSIGIYKITRDNEIYIGSTTVGFRVRFLGHLDKGNTISTLEMLNSGAIFEILEKCNNMTENEIRNLEKEYIKYYESMPEKYNLVNKTHLARNKRKKVYEYKIIKRFDTSTKNMVTEYKRGNKLLCEERDKIDNDVDVIKMVGLIKEEENVDEFR